MKNNLTPTPWLDNWDAGAITRFRAFHRPSFIQLGALQ